jgi:hypothetical protein
MPGSGTGPSFRYALDPRNDSRKFAPPGKVKGLEVFGVTGLPRLNARSRTVSEHIAVDRQRRRITGEHSDDLGMLQGEST